MLPGTFISSSPTIYFFPIIFFFECLCLYFSEYDIQMFLFVFWLRNRPSIKYVTRGMEEDHPKCVQVPTEGEGYHTLCVGTHLYYLFLCSRLTVSCFICRNLTLASFKKGVFVRNGYFCPMRTISVVMK